jgi:hypothetical protein
VFFAGDPAAFFARAGTVEGDLAGVRPEQLNANHRFAREMGGLTPWKAVFALTRMSGRAVDYLHALRKVYSDRPIEQRYFANDETFCYSHVVAAPDLMLADLAAAAPDWFAGNHFHADPDILIDAVIGKRGPGVFHPVRTRAAFMRSVVGRAVGSMTYLRPMRDSLALLSDDDIATLCGDLAKSTQHAIKHLIARHNAKTPPRSDGAPEND